MTTHEKITLAALAREDLYTFARLMFPVAYPGQDFDEAEYLRLLAAVLMTVGAEPGRRQLVAMPPRHLKSYFATVALTAWLLGRNPTLNLMIASHTQALSSTHLRLVRLIMKSEAYARVFATRIGGKDTEVEAETTEGGRALAVSFEAAPTGRGCHGLIIDDPLKADDAQSGEALESCERFYREALLSRLNHPGKGFVLVVMQRLAQGDLAGRLAETGAFQQLALPLAATGDERIAFEDISGRHEFRRAEGELLNPRRMTVADLEKLKSQWSDGAFAAQYQQQPVAAGGNLVKPEWLSYVDTSLSNARLIVQSWDTATALSESAAFSVCLTWRVGGDRFELMDVFRERVSPDQIGEVAEALAEQYRPKVVLVEEANTGYLVGTVLRRRGGLAVEMIRPAGSKAARLEQCVAAFQQAMVLLPRQAPWLAEYVGELLAFPGSRYADQVDATTLFLNWAMPRVLGDVRDPAFRQHKPVVMGTTAGRGIMMQVGRRMVPMGSTPSLRPRSRF